MDIKQDFIPINMYSRPGVPRKTTLAVVWHWVANPGTSAKMNRNYFAGLATPTNPAKPIYASSQFIIGLDGEIIQTMPIDEVAYHAGTSQIDPESGRLYTDKARAILGPTYCGNLTPNYATIGIELCHKDWMGEFNNKTLDAVIDLTAHLFKQYNNTLIDPKKQVMLHQEIVGYKKCPLWFCEHPDQFEYAKERVRQKLL